MRMAENLIPVSIIIATKNEEKNIADCLSLLKKFNEVIVVDSNSNDSTLAIASQFGAITYTFSWNGNMPKKRQWILENIPISNKWIFFLDADERISEELTAELASFMENHDLAQFAAGKITLKSYFCGQPLNFGHKIQKIALLKHNFSSFDIQLDDSMAPGMGEIEGHFQPSYVGKIYVFREKLDHFDSDELYSWYMRHVNYARWDAWVNSSIGTKKLINSRKTGKARFFHNLPGRPIIFFVYSYFWKLGFLDGFNGFRYTLSYTWYYWLCFLIKQDSKRTKNF